MSENRTYAGMIAADPVVIVAKCCECQRIREDGHWQFVRVSAEQNSIYSHTYCPACLKDAHANLDVLEAYAG